MKTWLKYLIVTVLVAIPAIPLGQMIWPAAAAESGDMHAAAPMATYQLVLFIVFSIIEALALGLGVAFLVFGLPFARRLAGNSGWLSWAVYLSIAWSLISWWPHDGFHRSGPSVDVLLALEYGFHGTLMAGGAVLVLAFLRTATRLAGAEQPESRVAVAEPRIGSTALS
ncbi:MAG TPA: hypothetical protein VF914_09410 [Chloroflexia bacterium]|jgi:hypothetical protein